MRNYTASKPKLDDMTLSKLGYWTDHGAYFYFFQSSPPHVLVHVPASPDSPS